MNDYDKAHICLIIAWLLGEINSVSYSHRRMFFIVAFIVSAGLNFWVAA